MPHVDVRTPARAGRELAIDSRATLQPLADEMRNDLRRRFRMLAVIAPTLTEDMRKTWQARLEKDYFACGCGEATVLSLLAVAGYLGWRVVTGDGFAALVALDFVGALAAFAAGTAVGKWIGRRRARARLLRSIEALSQLLPPGPQVHEHRRPCGHAA